MAEDAIDKALAGGRLSAAGPCRTKELPLMGAQGYTPALFTDVAQHYRVPHRPGAIDTRVARYLAGEPRLISESAMRSDMSLKRAGQAIQRVSWVRPAVYSTQLCIMRYVHATARAAVAYRDRDPADEQTLGQHPYQAAACDLRVACPAQRRMATERSRSRASRRSRSWASGWCGGTP